MMDILFIKKLTVMTIIGIYSWEKEITQKLTLDIKLGINIRPYAKKDKISSCVNYVTVINSVYNFIKNNKFKLIERVAEETADLLITKFNISWVIIKVSKNQNLNNIGNVSIIIKRNKPT
ncbi:MAG: dihydroneopterin aldolase [Enterobacterales bacterium]